MEIKKLNTETNEEFMARLTEETKKQILNLLTQMGCPPEEEIGNRTMFHYQGETFLMEIDRQLVQIIDPNWDNYEFTPDNLQVTLEAANWCNFGYGPRVVISAAPGEPILIHSNHDFIFHHSADDNLQSLKDILGAFFATKRRFLDCLRQTVDKKYYSMGNVLSMTGAQTGVNADQSAEPSNELDGFDLNSIPEA